MTPVVFEHPGWLQALWALPLVVLLYLVRRRAGRLLVPHLPLWEQVLDRARRRRPRLLRMLVAILMQLTVLSAAILYLATPVLPEQVPGKGHSIILLDRSLGTRALAGEESSLAARVIAKGAALARACTEQGTVSVGLLAGDGLRALVPATSDSARLDPSRMDLGVPAGVRSWEDVLTLAGTGDGSRRVRLILVTPFRPEEGHAVKLREAGVILMGVPTRVTNAGISSVRRRDGRIVVTLDGDEAPRELQVISRGEIKHRRQVFLAGGSTEVVLDLPREAGSEVELRLHPEDAFPEDDRAPLVIPERRRLKILVVAPGRTPFLDAFLAASSLIDAADSGRVEPAAFRPPDPRFDVTILVGFDLDQTLPKGRYLVLGGRFAGLPIARPGGARGAAQPVRVEKEDALVRALDLVPWVVHDMGPLRAESGLRVVVQGSLGPLISRGEVAGARFIHLAVPPDPRRSTLPLMEAFPLFLEAALDELAGGRKLRARLVERAGGVLSLLPGEQPMLLDPTGSELALDPLPDGTGFRLPEKIGRYRVAGVEPRRSLAVAVLDHPGRPGPPQVSEDPLVPFPDVERRHPVGNELLLVLGGLLLLEWVLYHRLITD